MKTTCRTVDVASHLAVAGVGAALWICWQPNALDSLHHGNDRAGATRETTRLAQDEITRRVVARDAAKQEAQVMAAKKITAAEDAKLRLAKQQADGLKNRQRLADLRKLSLTYQNSADLRSPLAEVLSGIGLSAQESFGKDAAMAIFLEWHRRDPAGALAELARRPAWLKVFENDYPVTLALGMPEILKQILNVGNTDHYRTVFLSCYTERLAETDDLNGLAEAYARMDEGCRYWMLPAFITSWIPRDGPAAVRAIFDEFSPELRRAMIDGLRNEWNGPWTADFTSALFQRDFGDLEYCRSGLKEDAERDKSLTYELSSESEELVPGDSKVFTAKPLGEGVEMMLLQDRDYPELFAAGKIGAEEIYQEMLRQLPVHAGEPELVARAVFKALAPHQPASAAAWAMTRINHGDLIHDTAGLLEGLKDPRTKRMVEVIKSLPADLPDGKETADLTTSIRYRFQFWAGIDRESATTAAAELPANHILARAAQGGITGKEADP